MIEIAAGPFRFRARFEEERAPGTVAAFRRALPFESKLIQARWSGQAAWVPMGDFDVGDLACRCVVLGRKRVDAIAETPRRHREHAAELASAEHADGGTWENR